MHRHKILLLLLIFAVQPKFSQVALKPFPQHTTYTTGSIKPNKYSTVKLDQAVITFYTQWKHLYIKSGCRPGEYHVWFQTKGNKQCVSEGQGYGMMTTAYMAGADRDAKNTFDGLFQYYKSHPAKTSCYLMAWAQGKNCKDLDKSTATDGDMDIAYALLLADKQWGSNGKINYLHAAKLMIGAIMKHEINRKTYSIMLSDAVEDDSKDYYDTRSSDFMPDHFRAFYKATHDERWNKVIDQNYRLLKLMQERYSPDAGLVPDFIRQINKKPKPVGPHYLESPYDGYYNYNACRVPWRIATDYLLYGDKRALAINTKINYWLRQTTKDNPDNISAGYTLDGNDIKGRYFEALSFIGPFAISAMTDSKNQQWLNSVYDYLVHFKLKDYDYYDNSIKLLDLIVLSGNYWEP